MGVVRELSSQQAEANGINEVPASLPLDGQRDPITGQTQQERKEQLIAALGTEVAGTGSGPGNLFKDKREGVSDDVERIRTLLASNPDITQLEQALQQIRKDTSPANEAPQSSNDGNENALAVAMLGKILDAAGMKEGHHIPNHESPTSPNVHRPGPPQPEGIPLPS